MKPKHKKRTRSYGRTVLSLVVGFSLGVVTLAVAQFRSSGQPMPDVDFQDKKNLGA